MTKIFAFLIMSMTLSCSNTDINGSLAQIQEYERAYPEGKVRFDASRNEYFLENFLDSVTVRESLVFDSSGRYIEYVFNNVLINKPRFIMKFNEEGKIEQMEGDPLFLASTFFKKELQIKDTFSVYIYMATPPNYTANVKVYQTDNVGRLQEVSNNKVKKNYQTLYVGMVDSNFTSGVNKLCVISELKSEGKYHFNRSDTAYFEINIK